MESSDVQDSLVVENALRSGNLEDIRIALMEVDRIMQARAIDQFIASYEEAPQNTYS